MNQTNQIFETDKMENMSQNYLLFVINTQKLEANMFMEKILQCDDESSEKGYLRKYYRNLIISCQQHRDYYDSHWLLTSL